MSISVRNLTRSFGGVAAVNDVSFDVAGDEFFAIVGPSGCGKSTLLRLVAGLERPDAGEVALDGEVVANGAVFTPPEERRVGVVFQSYALWPHLTVAGNVAFPYRARGVAKARAEAKAMAHLRTVELEEFAGRRPEALSGGQRQRVALARCLAGEARTVLMDEPLANLDPHLRGAMERELSAFQRRAGVATIYITHDQREAMALADRMAVMHEGRFLQVGAPAEIYDRPANARVAGFIGRGALLDAEYRGGAAHLAGPGFPVEFPVEAPAGRAEGPATLFLRPRDVAAAPEGEPGGVAARIAAARYRGGVWEAEAEAEGLAAPVALDLPRPVKPGEALKLRFTGGWVLPG